MYCSTKPPNYWNRCFPHIINLACKAVLRAITDLDLAHEDAVDYVPVGANVQSFLDALKWDIIATVRTLVCKVSSSMSMMT